MRVLIVDHASGLGGAEFSLEALVTSMPSSRCHYTVALPAPGPLVDRLCSRGVAVELVPMEGWRWWVDRPIHVLKFVLTLPFQLLSLLRWLRFLRSRHPDIIHFNINRLVEPVLAARLLRIPSVMHFRDIPSRVNSRFILGQRGFYSLMRFADAWVANSQATWRDIQPYARCPVQVIPNAIDLESFDCEAKDDLVGEAWMNTPHILAMVALLVPWKTIQPFCS